MKKVAALAAEALRAAGAETLFFLPGGPMNRFLDRAVELGIQAIDTRDERAAAFAAIAFSRVTQEPGVVVASAGPGTTNTVTGVAHAHADGAPVLILGGSTPLYQRGTGGFQETDQVALMQPITKSSQQVIEIASVGSAIASGYAETLAGSPGPVYIDLPADLLYAEAGDGPTSLVASEVPEPQSVDEQVIAAALRRLREARRPIVIAGSGVLWSRAWRELRAFIEAAQLPLFTTPIARGLVPEDHPLVPGGARTVAFQEADCVLAVGTRLNYVLNWLQPPVFAAEKTVIHMTVEPGDLVPPGPDRVGILGDACATLRRLAAEVAPGDHDEWVAHLRGLAAARRERMTEAEGLDATPIHPLALCDALERRLPDDAVLAVDGHEILGYSRQAILAHLPGRTLTPGAYGTMGVGIPFGVGAKVALPEAPVVVLTGDGAFGFHAMELDTAARHGLGIVVVISNNGGWGGGDHRQTGTRLERNDYHRLAGAVGGWGTAIIDPSELDDVLAEALERVRKAGAPAIVNVHTAPVRVGGRAFTHYAPV